MLSLARLAFVSSLASVALVVACSSEVTSTSAAAAASAASSSGQSERDASTSDACTHDCGTEVDAGCSLDQLKLIVDRQGGVPTRLHAPIKYNDAPAVLLVDMGSGTTFLQEPLGGPDPVPNAATFQIGCRSVDVDGRPEIEDSPVNGVPSVGTLGTDLLLERPTEIDLVGEQLLFHDVGVPFKGTESWVKNPFEVIYGAVLTPVKLDGMPVRLEIDTGAQDTVWVGAQPQPGDIEVDAVDAQGNIVKLYMGTVDLELGTAHLIVPVLRAPSFPYYQPPAKDVVGLLGLSSLGKGLVLDNDALELRVGL